jgi:uncharacterized coiled-coil protein SlyX
MNYTKHLLERIDALEEKSGIQEQLIDLLHNQVVDLSMMSKIELGDDVIAELIRLRGLLNIDLNKNF